jgi:hypothetical protein
MTRLGQLGVLPVMIAALALWLSPWVIPQHIALDFHQFALLYGAILIAYFAGAGAGAQLAEKESRAGSFAPGVLCALAGLAAALPNGVFFISLGAPWRHGVILALLVYLLMRDLNAAAGGFLAKMVWTYARALYLLGGLFHPAHHWPSFLVGLLLAGRGAGRPCGRPLTGATKSKKPKVGHVRHPIEDRPAFGRFCGQ